MPELPSPLHTVLQTPGAHARMPAVPANLFTVRQGGEMADAVDSKSTAL